jgi:hypothetical protein
MTLPANFPLSLSQIAAELGLSLPLSLNNARVLALAGKSALPVSFSNFLGQAATQVQVVPVSLVGGGPTQYAVGTIPASNFFSGVLGGLVWYFNTNGEAVLTFNTAPPTFTGNITVTNDTTGVSAVLSYSSVGVWIATSVTTANWMRPGYDDTFTISG